MALYGTAAFLSAFLLFLVQPLIGKYILPWFGGSPAVWNACMLFFQALLLAGYAYSHFLASRLAHRVQPLVHALLLAATLVLLPIVPSEAWKPLPDQSQVWRILGLLAASIGAPYFILSTTAPLLQSWFSRAHRSISPYRLYSFSNFGSLLAILAYPFAIEPRITTAGQVKAWSWAYAGFILLGLALSWTVFRDAGKARMPRSNPGSVFTPDAGVQPAVFDRFLWLALAACGSVLLLATTNQLCQDVAVVPLLWILPLALYLLTFILCFHHERWYSRIVCGTAFAGSLALSCYVLFGSVFVDLPLQIASYSATLFTGCMVCHGELVRLKPGNGHLTSFYLAVAGGGALGGAFVTLAAPRLFAGFWEYHLGLALTAVLLLVVLFRDRRSPLFGGSHLWAWTILWGAFFALAASLAIHIQETRENRLDAARNFFGVLRVLDEESGDPQEHHYTLMHGRIEHGFQYRHPEKRFWPTSYFGPASGVGVAIVNHPNRFSEQPGGGNLRVGIVGLGTGTLATYGQQGDLFRFYEINPEVVRFSEKYFTYRNDSAATVEVVLGDARISMERERFAGHPMQYDILAVDAFSSDAIPVHLLTRECFQTYLYHLKEDGVLALHISNRYFDLAPVARGLATLEEARGMRAYYFPGEGSSVQGTDDTTWILLTNNIRFLGSPIVHAAVQSWPEDSRTPTVWTDSYTNLFALYKK